MLKANGVAEILIADDSDLSRAFAGAQARIAGHAVVEVASGEEALERFDREAFDLILLDDLMPRLDGFETCRKLRRLPGGRDVPIAFMTGVDDTNSIEEAMAAGGDDILIKPLHAAELHVRMRALLRTYEVLRMERAATLRAVQHQQQIALLAEQKDALAEFIIHDLKSPLACMSFTLSEMLTQQIPDHYRSALNTCLRATESASRMVMNLLDLSTPGRLSVRVTACPVPSLFQHLRDRFAARFDLRGVSLQARMAAPTIWADGDLLWRVAENLVDNALRYAPPGSLIELSVEPSDGGAVLEVLDHGPGVPSAHRERIFDRFVQLDPEASVRASRGLGLAFCRLAVEAHGGWIRATDGPQGGARFSAFFPRPAQEATC